MSSGVTIYLRLSVKIFFFCKNGFKFFLKNNFEQKAALSFLKKRKHFNLKFESNLKFSNTGLRFYKKYVRFPFKFISNVKNAQQLAIS